MPLSFEQRIFQCVPACDFVVWNGDHYVSKQTNLFDSFLAQFIIYIGCDNIDYVSYRSYKVLSIDKRQKCKSNSEVIQLI